MVFIGQLSTRETNDTTDTFKLTSQKLTDNAIVKKGNDNKSNKITQNTT